MIGERGARRRPALVAPRRAATSGLAGAVALAFAVAPPAPFAAAAAPAASPARPAARAPAPARAAAPASPRGAPATTAGPSGGDEIPRPPDDDRDRYRIIHLQDAINEILHGRTLGRMNVALRVMSARTGRVYYGRHPDVLMDPASNQKVLATAAALMRLGSDWRYRTEVTGPGPDDDGVIHGSIHLRGNGDPTLRSGDLDDIAAHLRARGVTRVDGGVLADPRPLGYDGPAGEGETSDVKAPLLIDRGLMIVRVRPGAAPGSPPVVYTDQRRFADDAAGPGIVVRNQAVTRPSGRTKLGVRIETAGSALRVNVTGKISVGAAGVAFRRRVPHPGLHAAVVLRSALIAAGIAVRGAAGLGPDVPGEAALDVRQSPPMAVVMRRINKDSDNEQAERVLQTVGAEVYGGPATTEKGLAVLRAVVGSLGLRPNSYVSQNGSGLGHSNRITATAMADLLRALYFDPRIGPEILQSLSVGGIDGTTRNRFRGSLAARRVRAKTGTLNGKSCLSGLVGDGGDIVVFSMLMQGTRSRANLAAVRASQVAAVNAMMRFVREGTGERIDAPVPLGDERMASADVESGGDADESGEEGEAEPEPFMRPAAGEDPVDALLRQERAPAPGAGGAGGHASAVRPAGDQILPPQSPKRPR